jgi:hypothetical protein
MFIIKAITCLAIVVLCGMAQAAGPGPGHGPGPAPLPEILMAHGKFYYLTEGVYQGDEVLEACADGYHLASVWELLDVSDLTYNRHLGISTPDSGYGPPAGYHPGWLRRGDLADNCEGWSSIEPETMGLVGWLDYSDLETGNGWVRQPIDCGDTAHVWCVSDSWWSSPHWEFVHPQ